MQMCLHQCSQCPPSVPSTRRSIRKSQISIITPIRAAHCYIQARQVLAPRAFVSIFVEIVYQHKEANKNTDEAAGPNEPPRPPCGFATFEETDWLFGEFAQVDGFGSCCGDCSRALLAVLWECSTGNCNVYVRVDLTIRDLVTTLTQSFSKRVGRVKDTDTEAQTHQEATNMTEIIETRKQTKDKRDDDVEDEPDEILARRFAFFPGVEEVEQYQSEDAK